LLGNKKEKKKRTWFHAHHIAQFLGNNLFKARLLPLNLVQVFKNEKIASNCQVKFFFKKVEKKNATCFKELNSSQCVQYMKIFPKKIQIY
jgi:hypothetical protein